MPYLDINFYAVVYPSSSNFSIVLNETGTYGLNFQYTYPSNTYQIIATPTIYIKCYDPVCGNGIY